MTVSAPFRLLMPSNVEGKLTMVFSMLLLAR